MNLRKKPFVIINPLLWVQAATLQRVNEIALNANVDEGIISPTPEVRFKETSRIYRQLQGDTSDSKEDHFSSEKISIRRMYFIEFLNYITDL